MRNRLHSLVIGVTAAAAAMLFMPLLSGCGSGGSANVQSEVTGHVLDSKSNDSPVAGATVNIGGKTAVTASDGSFDIKNPPLGTSTATVTVTGNAPQTIAFQPAVQPLPAIDVTLTLNIGQIGGRVLLNGQPVANVSVIDQDTGDTVVTASDGTFLLIDVPLSASGTTSTIFMVKATATASKNVTVVAGLNNLGDVTLTDTGTGAPPNFPAPTIKGTIHLSDTNTAPAGTTVFLLRNNNQFLSTLTDNNGAYSFYAPVDANYTIIGNRTGYQNKTSAVFSVTDPRTTVQQDLTLDPNP